MNPVDVDELYYALLQHIREDSLEWLADDVQRQVSQGTEIRSDQLDDGPDSIEGLPMASGHGRRSPRNVNRDLTPEERLGLLLDALDGVVCGPVFLLDAIFKIMPQIPESTLDLTVDFQGNENGELTFSRRDSDQRVEIALKLKHLLAQVRGELYGGNF